MCVCVFGIYDYKQGRTKEEKYFTLELEPVFHALFTYSTCLVAFLESLVYDD